ncbi:hypothetical protein KAJ83_09720 [Marivibrio halodurans]|uniref:Bacteriophage lambda head decoration protein D n=1 Tax=Marivibrio halodurans TaxID=2039722 RepID=A0A8J7SMY5_9PROT|nr:hypothetical protein [Marivibrio halodurans]MBP5857286.1 hypothetical protein [Marivibrio halodurans]
MTALSNDRNTPMLADGIKEYPVAASTICYAGGLAVLNAGVIEPATTDTGLVAVGRFEGRYDNSNGSAGDIKAKVRQGVFRWANSAGGDEITAADIGALAYIVDDQTVAKTDDTGSRSAAGRIEDIDANGVWVRTDFTAIS